MPTAAETEKVFYSILDKVEKAGNALSDDEILEFVMFGSETNEEKNSTEAKYKIAKNIRANIQLKLIDISNKTYQKINEITDKQIEEFSDPYGISEMRKTAKADLEKKWEDLKKKLDSVNIDLSDVTKQIKDKTEASATSSSPLLSADTNKAFSIIADKLEKLVDIQTNTRKVKINEGNFNKVKEKSGLSESVLKNFYAMALETKKEKAPLSQELYEVGPKTFELDEKSIMEISKKLNLKDEETDALLKGLLEDSKEQKSILGDIAESLKGSLLKSLTELFTVLAAGVAAIIFGKPLLELVDKMFGTNLTQAFDQATSSLQKFSGFILDGLKVGLMAISVLTQTLKGIGGLVKTLALGSLNTIKNGFGDIMGGIKSSVGGWFSKISAQTSEVAGSSLKAAGDVGKVASEASGVAKAAGDVGKVASEASGVAKGTEAASEVLAGSIAKTGAKAVAKAGLGSLLKGGLGFILKKIPFIGAIIDVGAGVSDIVQGDYVGGTLRMLAALSNLIPVVGPFIGMFVDFLDDMLTEKAGTKNEKKSFGMFLGILQDIGKNIIKFIFGWAPSWITDPIFKFFGIETSGGNEAPINSKPENGRSLPENKPEALEGKPSMPQGKGYKGDGGTSVTTSEIATSSPTVVEASKEAAKQQQSIMIPSDVVNALKDQTGGEVDLTNPNGFMSKIGSLYGMGGKQGSVTISDLARSDVMPSMMSANAPVGLDPSSAKMIADAVSIGGTSVSISGGSSAQSDDSIVISSRNDHLDYQKSQYRNTPNRLH
jgi:predicted PurR-regulated permease PerM